MPSSNSGFQRLPQATLSRSRFLRLAAGALLPAVGWRLPAAAANPQLAQNSGATGTKDAAAPGRMGAILVSQFGLRQNSLLPQPRRWLAGQYADD